LLKVLDDAALLLALEALGLVRIIDCRFDWQLAVPLLFLLWDCEFQGQIKPARNAHHCVLHCESHQVSNYLVAAAAGMSLIVNSLLYL
jgi:hypothetical protein